MIDAAQVVMSRKGVEAATIAEITEEADVGFGSFYNHFTSKAEIAEAIVAIHASQLADDLDRIFNRVPDIALAASFVQRSFIDRVKHDPIWGWFIVNADTSMGIFERFFRKRLVKDLSRIVEQRRLHIPALGMATTLTLAALSATMRQQLEGTLPAQGSSEMVEALLRMYGLPHDEAHRVAFEPMPDWLTRPDPESK